MGGGEAPTAPERVPVDNFPGSSAHALGMIPEAEKTDAGKGSRLPAKTFFALAMPPRFILRDSLDRDRLEKLYLRDGLSMVQIGKRFGVSATAVCRLLDEYDIPRRGTISLSIRHES